MVWPNPAEVAVLTIDGFDYRDWESVQVTHSRIHPFYTFKFTCSEGMPLAKNWAAMRILPGQWCTITLGGTLAFSGWVCSRQVFYDARRHHIEIQGASDALPIAYSSVINKTGEFKNVTPEQIARSILTPFNLYFGVEGGPLSQEKIPRYSLPPGVTALETLEDIFKPIGVHAFTSRPEGGIVALVGPAGGEDTVTEGINILEGREIIFNPGMADGSYLGGQSPGTDKKWGANVASVPFLNTPFSNQLVGGYAPLMIALESPAWGQQFLSGRGTAEKELQGSDLITVFVVTQGWMRPSGGLWVRNQIVRVISPMLVMDGSIRLTAKNITFSQDNIAGTRTTLELCNDAALNAPGPVSSSE